MIVVECLLGLRQIDDLLGALLPRQIGEPVQVGAGDGVFGCRHGHLREAIELPLRFLLDRLRHARGVDLLLQFLDLAGLVVAFAQLFLNRLQLLPKEVFALVFPDFRLHLRLDLRPELEHLELFDQDAIERVHSGADVEGLEHLLFDRSSDRREARGNEVRQPAGFGDVGRQRLQVVGQ
jgi:hypothetical protein